MLIGGRGWMAGPACVAPRASVELYELCRQKRWDAAMALQLQGYDVGAPLPPQAPLAQEGVSAVRAALAAIGADAGTGQRGKKRSMQTARKPTA